MSENTQDTFVGGHYQYRTNGGDWEVSKNLIPIEGRNHMLGVTFNQATPTATWYLALFTNNYTPVNTLTAAAFATSAGEIISSTEGYTQPNRVEWVEGAPDNGSISNAASKASFTFATTSTVTVYGAALLSSNIKGSTLGKLMSITKFPTPRTFYNGDTFDLIYTVGLTES